MVTGFSVGVTGQEEENIHPFLDELLQSATHPIKSTPSAPLRLSPTNQSSSRTTSEHYSDGTRVNINTQGASQTSPVSLHIWMEKPSPSSWSSRSRPASGRCVSKRRCFPVECSGQLPAPWKKGELPQRVKEKHRAAWRPLQEGWRQMKSHESSSKRPQLLHTEVVPGGVTVDLDLECVFNHVLL